MMTSTQTKGDDYTLIFDQMKEAEKVSDYYIVEDAICAVRELEDPIERLRQIVIDNENFNYRVSTFT